MIRQTRNLNINSFALIHQENKCWFCWMHEDIIKSPVSWCSWYDVFNLWSFTWTSSIKHYYMCLLEFLPVKESKIKLLHSKYWTSNRIAQHFSKEKTVLIFLRLKSHRKMEMVLPTQYWTADLAADIRKFLVLSKENILLLGHGGNERQSSLFPDRYLSSLIPCPTGSIAI